MLGDTDDEEVDLDNLSPEDRAAVEEGSADIEAGRVVPADKVFDRLTAKYEAMANARWTSDSYAGPKPTLSATADCGEPRGTTPAAAD